jgi:hypothetical protein
MARAVAVDRIATELACGVTFCILSGINSTGTTELPVPSPTLHASQPIRPATVTDQCACHQTKYSIVVAGLAWLEISSPCTVICTCADTNRQLALDPGRAPRCRLFPLTGSLQRHLGPRCRWYPGPAPRVYLEQSSLCHVRSYW